MKPCLKHYLEKSCRLKQPKSISVNMRPEVYDFLRSVAAKNDATTVALIRGILEDFYDFYSGKASDQEVQ